MIQYAFVFVLEFNQSHASNRIIIFKRQLNLCRQLKTCIKMKILIPLTQVYEAFTKGYGRIGLRVAKTKTSLPVAQLASSPANLTLTLLE